MATDNESREQPNMNVQQSTSSSYLVRVWREPGQDAEVRFYLRNLKTGEERYLGDAERLEDILKTGLRKEQSAQAQTRTTAQAG